MSDLPRAGATILLVDDNERLRDRLAVAMTDRGYTARTADGPPNAIACMMRHDVDYAIVDLRMPGGSGLQLLEWLQRHRPTVRTVVLTGYGSIATAVDAVKLGAVNFLQKPADADMILAAFGRGEVPPLDSSPDYEPPSLARAEWDHINRVLDDCGGNITKAAEKLGLHRRTLQRKLQKYPPRT